MKKRTFFLCLLAVLSFALVSCDKPEPDPEPDQPTPVEPIPDDPDIPDNPVSEDTTSAYSTMLLGKWVLERATQDVSGNVVDITNFYGSYFSLLFEEDGTLITANGIEDATMQWTLDGDQLGFIQLPGMDPVMYTIKKITEDELDIENGAGTEYVTLLELNRAPRK